MSTTDHTDPQSQPGLHATSDPETDRILFARIATGDESAFETLFHTHNRRLFPFVLSITKNEADTKEVIQDIFLKVWLKRETLPTVENPGAWLHTVAANAAYEHLRKEARYALRLQNVAADTRANETNLSDIHEQFDRREIRDLIREAVDKLPARRRRVFQMARLEGYSRKEIAETLGISENTVRNQLTEAAEFVHEYILKNGPLYLPMLLIVGLF